MPVPGKHHIWAGHLLSHVHVFFSLFLFFFFFNSPTAYLSTQFLFLQLLLNNR